MYDDLMITKRNLSCTVKKWWLSLWQFCCKYTFYLYRFLGLYYTIHKQQEHLHKWNENRLPDQAIYWFVTYTCVTKYGEQMFKSSSLSWAVPHAAHTVWLLHTSAQQTGRGDGMLGEEVVLAGQKFEPLPVEEIKAHLHAQVPTLYLLFIPSLSCVSAGN